MNASPTTGSTSPPQKAARGEPAWDVALLFPRQGAWSEDDYLALDTNHLVELADGCLEVLPMPNLLHQAIVKLLARLLDDFVRAHTSGGVFFAPLPVRLFPGTYREPDILYMRPERLPDDPRTQLQGADLVVEVVSEGDENRRRDLETKRKEYAQAGIAEYWIVDPEKQRITVLTLDEQKKEYRVHGEFGPQETATSLLLSGFEVAVKDVFTAAERQD